MRCWHRPWLYPNETKCSLLHIFCMLMWKVSDTEREWIQIHGQKECQLPLRVNVAVLTPITWPCESIRGPPEFPVRKNEGLSFLEWNVSHYLGYYSQWCEVCSRTISSLEHIRTNHKNKGLTFFENKKNIK